MLAQRQTPELGRALVESGKRWAHDKIVLPLSSLELAAWFREKFGLCYSFAFFFIVLHFISFSLIPSFLSLSSRSWKGLWEYIRRESHLFWDSWGMFYGEKLCKGHSHVRHEYY